MNQRIKYLQYASDQFFLIIRIHTTIKLSVTINIIKSLK